MFRGWWILIIWSSHNQLVFLRFLITALQIALFSRGSIVFLKSSWSRCGQRLSLWFGIDDNTFILVRSSSDLIWFRWDFNNGLLTGRGCVDAGRNNRRWCVDNRLHTTCFYTPDEHRRVWRLWRRDQSLLKNNKMNKELRTRTDNWND